VHTNTDSQSLYSLSSVWSRQAHTPSRRILFVQFVPPSETSVQSLTVVSGLLHGSHMNPSQPQASPQSSPSHSRQPSAMQQPSASSSSASAAAADPLAQLAQLQQNQVAMQQQLQQQALQQQQQFVHLQQAAVAQAAAAAAGAQPAAAPRQLPKIAPPPRFKGVMGAAADTWLSALEQQFTYYVIADDASKLRLGSCNLEGDALLWYNALLPKPLTWDEFVEALRKRFRPVAAVQVARQHLAKYRQAPGQTVSSYTHGFLTIKAVIDDMSPADQVFQYTNGLLPSIASRVWEKQPATLPDAIQEAASREATLGFSARGGAGQSHFRPSASSSSGSVPMDINHVALDDEALEDPELEPAQRVRFADEPFAMRESALLAKMEAIMEHRLAALSFKTPSSNPSNKSGDRVKGLKSGDIERLMKEGKCFRCKQTGHMKRDCPQAPKSSN